MSFAALNREMRDAGLGERVKPVKLLNMVYDEDRNLSLYRPTYVHSCHLKIPSDVTKLPHLDEGYENHIKRCGKYCYEVYEGSYESVPEAILGDAKIYDDFKSGKYDIVCHRGMLTRCAMNAYDKKNMALLIMKYKGVLFFKELCSESKIRYEANRSELELKMEYWGFRFQKMVTSEETGSSGPVNRNKEYCSAFTVELGAHRLFYVAEMNCVDPETGEDVEIKTQRIFAPSTRQEKSFYIYKTKRWFLQSLFGGVHKIVAGMRSDDGVIQRIDVMNARDLPLKSRQVVGRSAWTPDVCVKFVSDMFDDVRSAELKESVVYKATWKPGQTKFSVQPCAGEKSFLPQWFLEKV